MKQTVLIAALLAGSVTAIAQQSPSAERGEQIFDKWCAPCHGSTVTEPGGMFPPAPLPGTAALGVKYKGEIPAVLEERTDLLPDYIRVVVRQGLFGMPISRKTEISDADLEDIVAYLTDN
jgi:mono/diheme cytochrome c family protein